MMLEENRQTEVKPWGLSVNAYCSLMHLAQLAGWIVPLAGLILPIVMWAVNKDESEVIDRQGKKVLNWMISMVIYAAICWLLVILFIGIPLLVGLFILNLVFIVIAAVKAGEGEEWDYPMSFKFFS